MPLQERRLLAALARRCRDRDEAVRAHAWQALLKIPPPTLHGGLSTDDWLALLDTGLLAGSPPGNEEEAGGAAAGRGGKAAGGSGSGGKHGTAIHDAAQQLLFKFVLPGGSGDTAEEAAGAAGLGGLEAPELERDAGWEGRLLTLRRHARELGVAAEGLKAAYDAALRQVVTPELLLSAAAAGTAGWQVE